MDRQGEFNQFTEGTARETDNFIIPSMENIIDGGQGAYDNDLVLKRIAVKNQSKDIGRIRSMDRGLQEDLD